MRSLCLLLIFSVFCTIATAQQPNATPSPSPAGNDERLAESTPVVTHHQITVAGKLLKYTATAGRLILKPESGPAQAAVFFTAYTLDGEDAHARPLTFVFNGGPGTATAWLHMGALGPRKIKLERDGGVPAPPYAIVANPETVLQRGWRCRRLLSLYPPLPLALPALGLTAVSFWRELWHHARSGAG